MGEWSGAVRSHVYTVRGRPCTLTMRHTHTHKHMPWVISSLSRGGLCMILHAVFIVVCMCVCVCSHAA